MGESHPGVPPAGATQQPAFNEQLLVLNVALREAEAQDDGKLPTELVDRALALDEGIAVGSNSRGDARLNRYYAFNDATPVGQDADSQRAARRVHRVAAAARGEQGNELSGKPWARALAEAGIEPVVPEPEPVGKWERRRQLQSTPHVKAEGGYAWMAEGYRMMQKEPGLASGLDSADQTIFDAYVRQRKGRIAVGLATTPDEAVEVLQKVTAEHGASSYEATEALADVNDLLSPKARNKFVKIAEKERADAERDVEALGDVGLAEMSDEDIAYFVAQFPHLHDTVTERRERGLALLAGAEQEIAAAPGREEVADIPTAGPDHEDRANPVRQLHIPADWRLAASSEPETGEPAESSDEHWSSVMATLGDSAREFDGMSVGSEGADGSAETNSTGADVPPTQPARNFNDRLGEIFARVNDRRREFFQEDPDNPERSRRRRKVAGFVGTAAVVGAGFIAWELFKAPPEHVAHLFPEFAPSGSGSVHGAVHEVTLGASDPNPYIASEHALEQSGVASPTPKQIMNIDDRAGRNLMTRLGERFSVSAWYQQARHLASGTKLYFRTRR